MQIYLLDFNEKMVDAWKKHFHPIFDDVAPVEFIQSDFGAFMEKHESDIDAVVSPANAYGLMDGGYDATITEYFGRDLQLSIQNKIIEEYFGEQPVGTSISIKIPNSDVLLIHTPTMRTPSTMGYCQRCGGYCADNYTFCKRCYIALGSPYGTSISKGHECRKCGKTIFGRYNYCPDCAKRLGFLKEGY